MGDTRSLIDCSAMGAAAFAVNLLATVAADVGRADAREVLIEGESDVCHPLQLSWRN